MNIIECYICKTPAESELLGDMDGYKVKCPVCGYYKISGPLAASDLSYYSPRYKISAGVRKIYEAKTLVMLTTTNVKNIAESIRSPRDPFEAIDMIIGIVLEKSGKGNKFIDLHPEHNYSLVCAESAEEFGFYLQKAVEIKYLEQEGHNYRLTLSGWERYALIREIQTISTKVFVAMWFDSSLDEVWQNGIKSAIEDCGFQPVRIDLQQHNEKICDRIVAEIRQSAFVVADFTGQRGGVYYEAGFAIGLGKPVIWTVKRSDMANLHFDTRQYNHIPWDSSVDLKESLVNRILATIPKPISKK